MSDPALLDVRELCAGYGRSQVLFGVSLVVPRRGGVAILGRNGAGKTTLLKTLIGELRAGAGSIRFAERDVLRLSPERRVRLGIGYVPQQQSVFNRLSVRENLEVGRLSTRQREGIDRVLAMFPKLEDRLDQAAGTLSGGERKMLAISRALLGNPKLLLLDEPTEGVWIGVIEEIAERLDALAQEIAVVIVEQHLELALRVAENVHVLDRGKVALSGSSAKIRSDPKLMYYLAP